MKDNKYLIRASIQQGLAKEIEQAGGIVLPKNDAGRVVFSLEVSAGELRKTLDLLLSLNIEDFVQTEGTEEGEFVVRGKGNKERVAYVYNGAAYALADWLLIRGPSPGPLFVAINKGGVLKHGHRPGAKILVLVHNEIVLYQDTIDARAYYILVKAYEPLLDGLVKDAPHANWLKGPGAKMIP